MMSEPKPVRVLVVDDEPLASERITTLLSKFEGVEIVGVASNGDQAVDGIRAVVPDVVFLDIQMPGMNGFDVIREIGPENAPIIVFVTAYDQYAVRAFDLAAVDYLLKPFEDERIEQALQRAKGLLSLKQSNERAERITRALETLGLNLPSVATLKPAAGYIDRIAVESRNHLRVLLTQQIDYVTASGVYAELHVGEKTYVIRERMQALEQRLDPRYFFRIHRSVIVQLDRIEVLIRQTGGDYMIKLKSGIQLTVSRNRIDQLERWMGVQAH